MSSPSEKKRTYASNAILYAIFVAGAVVLVNLISTRYFGRVDLTEKKVFTLSQPSRDLVKKMDDYLTVKAFISEELPPDLKTLSTYVRDLVDEYKSSSNGKFRWEAVIDRSSDKNWPEEEKKKLDEEARRCKVQKFQLPSMHGSKFELGTYYLGLCLQYHDKVESIPQIGRPEGLEYQVTSLIKKMTVKKKKIAFTTGHGESDPNQGFQSFKRDLEQEYDLTTVNPSTGEIAADVDAIIVGGPKQAIDEKGQREIDRFIMTGKGAVILSDGMVVSQPSGMNGMQMGQMAQVRMAQSNDSGLSKLLDGYGFKVGTDFVMDREAAVTGAVDVGGGRLLPLTAPVFLGAAVEQALDLPVVSGIRAVVFPYASSVTLTGPLADGKVPANGKLWKVAASGPTAWKHEGFFVVTPEALQKLQDSKTHGPFGLAYAYQGPLKSAFVQSPAAAVSAADSKQPLAESAKPVRLVVVGDSDFASDEYMQLVQHLRYFAAGAQLLYNAIGWTVEDEALIPLRGKTMDSRPLTVSSEGTLSAYRWVNVLGLPLLFCLFGVLRWRLRNTNRANQKL